MASSESREEGHYWIKRHELTEVAYWDGSAWWLWGTEVSYDDDPTRLKVISPKLEPPNGE